LRWSLLLLLLLLASVADDDRLISGQQYCSSIVLMPAGRSEKNTTVKTTNCQTYCQTTAD